MIDFNQVGIMQGRLLPKFKGRYQAHPLNYWEDEFQIAKKLKLNYIEFILDYNDYDKNPLMFDNGVYEIMNVIQKTGVGVKSVCADYFMEAPLHSSNNSLTKKSSEVLNQLIKNASKIGISDIVIPCVDQSSLNSEFKKEKFIYNLTKSLSLATKYNINLALETDLSPNKFLELLDQFDSEKITVNYDTGNSASLGYNMEDEFESYGNKISDIHIKDRKKNGESVFLGNGDVDFFLFYKLLKELNYNGPIILQAYRDEEGLDIFKKQFKWLKNNYTSYDCNYSR